MPTLYLLDTSGSMEDAGLDKFLAAVRLRHERSGEPALVAVMGEASKAQPLDVAEQGLPQEWRPNFPGTFISDDLEDIAAFCKTRPDIDKIVIFSDLLDVIRKPTPAVDALLSTVATQFVVAPSGDDQSNQMVMAQLHAALGDRVQSVSFDSFAGGRQPKGPGRR